MLCERLPPGDVEAADKPEPECMRYGWVVRVGRVVRGGGESVGGAAAGRVSFGCPTGKVIWRFVVGCDFRPFIGGAN